MMRLNPGTAVAGIVAILLSVSGAFLARQFLLQRADAPPPVESVVPKVETIIVPIATTDLPVNRVIRKGDIGTLRLTKEELGKKNYPSFIGNPLDIGGRILKRPIKSMGVFSPDDLYPEGTGPTVADDLEPGLRAVTINVSDSGFVDGYAAPGTYVDVLFRLDTKAGGYRGRQPVTYTMLSRVRVLAVERASFPGTKVDPPTNSTQTVKVTLAVTPEQAGQLRVLDGNGELSLSLRSPEERPRDAIQSELDEANALLAKFQQESESLMGIIAEAAEAGLKFDDKGRIEDLKKKIGDQEQIVARLDKEIHQTPTVPPQQRLAEVLRAEPTIAKNLPPGMRAVTVGVKGSGFVDGFAVAGTFVDVLFRLPAGDGRKGYKETTFAVVERVEVLALDKSVEPLRPADAGPQTADQEARVTLAVTAEQASKLKVIEGRGELSLAIRSPNEKIRETVEKELSEANDRLAELNRDARSLNEIIAAAAKMGAEFDDNGRGAELAAQIAEQERIVGQLGGDLKVAVKLPEQQRLDEVLKLGATPTIVEKLPAGKRAVTLLVKGSGVVDGYAVSGTFVDVLFRLSQLEGRKDYKETTFTIAEAVEVLAVDQSTDTAPQSDAGSQDRGVRVTLAVNPDQAARLKVVEGRGELSLLLRSPKEAGNGGTAQPRTTAATDEVRVAVDVVQLELEELRIEQDALRQIEKISARRGAAFSRQSRLEELANLIRDREDHVAQLEAKQSQGAAAESTATDPAASKYTLAAVLGIPEPEPAPPPPADPPSKTMEIYMGGSRKTMMFIQEAPTPAAAPTAAGAPGKEKECKDCKDKQKYPGRTVIRRPVSP